MRACVQPDDGVCSDWLEVEQGLRQGFVLSPLLFSIFFAAVLNVAQPEPAMDYVRRAVWGMLYADYACIVSRSPQGLAKMIEVIVEVLPSLRVNIAGEEDKDYVYASTAHTADNGASRSSRTNLQTGVIFYLVRGRRDRNPGYVRRNRQADPRMLDAHQAVPT